ncbi:drug/metabolite transporter (DMT)-like permease [Methylopila capsulata]|uniref:Permease n=1 Tax=Methylopila capsulata TaxID=61654 RepID=A0A9W6MU59_9HYPH|nr:DMT family transporter [Methylopila capsulata]MBM7852983.1 drug/metabolite transporter (DMT)-like permease [Methylopila capsulata]GLK57806.1 permease [Methylopila capsulata]
MLLGVSCKLLSAFLFTVMASLVRAIGTDVPTGQVVFARSLFALVPLMAWLMWRGDVVKTLKTDRPLGHLLRSAIGVSSMFCMFAGLARLPLPDATVLGYASPLMTIIFAAVLLRERVRAHRWTAVAIGLAGVVIMLWPQLESGALASVVTGDAPASETAVGAAFAICATVLTAAAMIQIRRLTQSEGTGAIVFYFTVWSTVIGLTISLTFGWVWPDARTALLLVGTGLVGGVAQILLTEGYRHADASLIAPFEYTTILWALAIGFLAFGDLPSSSMVIGGAIVVGSGVAVVLRERKLGIKRARVRKASPPSPGA